MAISMRAARPKRIASEERVEARPVPSVREVCLLGPVPSAPLGSSWSAGDRLTWSGRSYRVEATQDAPWGAPGYMHLASAGEG